MTAGQTALFLLCVVLATGAQAMTGFAFALILLGLAGVLQLAPLPDVANVATVLSLANAAVALRHHGRRIDRTMLRHTVLGSVVGVALGVALLGWLSANVVLVLRLLLGLTVIACAIVVLLQAHALQARSGSASFWFYGLLSGVLGGLFSASGPPLVYHYYRQPLALEALRGTLVAALAASSGIRLLLVVPTGAFSLHALQLSLLAAPLVVLVTWLLHRYPPGWSRQSVLKLVCALLLATGGGLIAPVLSAWR